VNFITRKLKQVDISNNPDLLRIVEEMRASNEPRILRRHNEDVAILTPSRKRRAGRDKTKADYEAFRSAAGGWKDVDTDKLIADIYADRALSDRSAVEL
jgi:hypothetical protein